MATRTRPALGADPRRVPGLRGAATWSGRGRRRPIAAGRRRGTPGRGEGAEVGAGGATEDARCTAVRRDRDACTVTRCTGPRIALRQRRVGAAPCVAAAAEHLPSEDRSFDVATAVSTVHHRADPVTGLRGMRRVARRAVVLDGFPRPPRRCPRRAGARCGGLRRRPVRGVWAPAGGVPGGSRAPCAVRCRCGPGVGPQAERRAVRSLADDPGSGRWAARNGRLAGLDAADLGLRLIVACPTLFAAPRRAAGPPATGPCPGVYRGGSHRGGRVTVPGRCSKVSMTSHSSSSGS
ncbi:methyltransferase domain-containing protein [Streptomyces sp. NRRL F-4474]|uniref:methyltransferase domain-containing protein n=1 Tax=Streptomyces sp. NRRL F-4474 TaxID=1463851 RepID=UPI003B63F778